MRWFLEGAFTGVVAVLLSYSLAYVVGRGWRAGRGELPSATAVDHMTMNVENLRMEPLTTGNKKKS